MRIDAHQHFWRFDPRIHSWITDDMSGLKRDFLPDDLAPLLAEHAIDGCVTVQVDQTEEENHFMLSLAQKHFFIKGIVGWIDLRADNLPERLEHFRQFPIIKGFRHIVQGEQKGFLLDRKFIRGVSQLASHGFTYDLLIYHHQLEEAKGFVRQVGPVSIVVDHLAKPSIGQGEFSNWAKGIEALSDFENVHCKLSGIVTEANWNAWSYDQLLPYIEKTFECFSARRILYGSDWPVCRVAASYHEQYSIVNRFVQALSETERNDVFGENAKTFYNL